MEVILSVLFFLVIGLIGLTLTFAGFHYFNNREIEEILSKQGRDCSYKITKIRKRIESKCSEEDSETLFRHLRLYNNKRIEKSSQLKEQWYADLKNLNDKMGLYKNETNEIMDYYDELETIRNAERKLVHLSIIAIISLWILLPALAVVYFFK